MIENVKKVIDEYGLIQNRETIIVAVSGGPDSMCLLDILRRLKCNYDLKLIVAHFNHCTRGEESDGDEIYVKEYCQQYGISFFSARKDIEEIAKSKGISTEMAGREERYKFFQYLYDKYGANKIALAHNSNDLAETVLMRIIRGTGLEGLEGIKPIRENKYIRPVLFCNRDSIEEYCDKENLNPRIDKTNKENIYSRNKIRLELIPYIEENFNKDIINTINRLAKNAKVDNDYFEKITREMFEKYCSIKEDQCLIKKQLFNEHEAMITRVIRYAFSKMLGSTYNFERKHIYDIIEVQGNISGKGINLPKNLIALNSYGDILIKYEDINETKKELDYLLKINENNYIEDINSSIIIKEVDIKELNFNKGKKEIKVFDIGKIKGDVSIRYKRPGDKIKPLGMGGSKKLKKVFSEMRIPVDERDTTPIICFGEEVAWVVGYMVSDKFKIDNKTKKVLQIEFIKEGNNNA